MFWVHVENHDAGMFSFWEILRLRRTLYRMASRFSEVGRGRGRARDRRSRLDLSTPSDKRPGRDRTPDGVFTQVQRKSIDEDEEEDLFQDVEVEEDLLAAASQHSRRMAGESSQQSNLTGIFTDFELGDDDDDVRKSSEDIGSKDESRRSKEDDDGDFLDKVMKKTLTEEERRKIECYEFDDDLQQGGEVTFRLGSKNYLPTAVRFSLNPQKDSGNDGSSTMSKGPNAHSTPKGKKKLTDEEVNRLLGSMTPVQISTDERNNIRDDSLFPEGSDQNLPNSGHLSISSMSSSVRGDVMETEVSDHPESSDISSEVLQAVQEVRHAKMKMVNGEMVPTGVVHHNYPVVDRSELKLDDHRGLDDSRSRRFTVTIPELSVPSSQVITRTFETTDISKFILVGKRAGCVEKWGIPPHLLFHDVINEVENIMRREKLPVRYVIDWQSKWDGDIGLLGLRMDNLAKLEMVRQLFTRVRIGGHLFNTFPKDGIAYSREVTTILRTDLRNFNVKFIPESLFDQNRLLTGKLKVDYSKPFEVVEYPDPEWVKNDWRTVYMLADEEFLTSLKKYPTYYAFALGSSTVILRTDRNPENMTSGVSQVDLARIQNIPSGDSIPGTKRRSSWEWRKPYDRGGGARGRGRGRRGRGGKLPGFQRSLSDSSDGFNYLSHNSG